MDRTVILGAFELYRIIGFINYLSKVHNMFVYFLCLIFHILLYVSYVLRSTVGPMLLFA